MPDTTTYERPDIWRVLAARDAIASTLQAETVCLCRPHKLPSVWCRKCSHRGKDAEAIATELLTVCGWVSEFGSEQTATAAQLIVASALEDCDEA